MADVPVQAVLNEAALKRFDPYVKEIIDTAKYVALYSFNAEENEWEKTNVEGSLFVYSRTGEPYHNILVLNRLSTTNLIEPISHQLDLQLQEPFLLYRNTKLNIYGIWFYEKEECTRLAALIKNLMSQSGGQRQSPTNNGKPMGGPNVDIFSMLSKAQEAYNGTKSTSKESKNSNKLSPQDVDSTPQSVMDFFAKAGSAPQKVVVPPPVPGPKRMILGRSSSAAAPEPEGPMNPFMHQLMSNPVHSVEHIEKQQRSVTPAAEASSNAQVLKTFIRPLSTGQTDVESQVKKPSKVKPENGVNGFNFLRISPSYQQSLYTNIIDSTEVQTTQNSNVETPQKPALMPPAMFTPSAPAEQATNNSIFRFDKPEPLTRNQLLQAITYLLKNDADFVNKIHEAYVKSLYEKVS